MAAILEVRDTNGNTIEIPTIRGKDGKSGVYVGSGDMPEGCNVQIDPEGETAIIPTVVQTAGESETAVMSQKAVTKFVNEAINGKDEEYETVNSVEEMTDTSKSYILSTTGTIWSYIPVETEVEVDKSEQIVSTEDNPAIDGASLSTSGTSANSSYVTTPYIDLHKYGFPCTLKLGGLQWVTETPSGKIRVCAYDENKEFITGALYSTALSGSGYWSYAYNNPDKVTIIDDTTATVEFSEAYLINSSKTVRYLRFCAVGTWAEADISVTYKGTETVISDPQWTNTGIAVTDVTEFALTNPSAKSFMDTVSYDDNNYSSSNIGTYASYDYFRKDLPLPVVLKWEEDSMATEYTVSIGTDSVVSVTTAQIYYTDRNRITIYNLIPNTTYYYKVHCLCANSTKKLLKEGNFITTMDRTRMLNIDGIQNVRDIGGYIGLDNKTVKYGLLFRGSAMDEDISRYLSITDKGRQEMLVRLGIRTDLDLRYGYTDSPLNVKTKVDDEPEVEFINTSSGYENYASAFTIPSQRTNFANILTSIVTRLTANKPVYIHCQGGCDRTGTLVFLLLGLLGVSESDLAKEYELSSFSPIGYTRTRSSTKYSGMVTQLKTYSGDTITDKFYTFATTANDDTETGGCSIDEGTITSFRNLMLK